MCECMHFHTHRIQPPSIPPTPWHTILLVAVSCLQSDMGGMGMHAALLVAPPPLLPENGMGMVYEGVCDVGPTHTLTSASRFCC